MSIASSIAALAAGAVVGLSSVATTVLSPAAGGSAPPPTGGVSTRSLRPPEPSPPYTALEPAPAPARTWSWPLTPQPFVVHAFDPPDVPWGSGHRGVDLAATVGQPVRAPADGRVGWAGVLAGRGVVVVVHAGGWRSTFEPVSPALRVGSAVTRGAAVGRVTSTPGHCAPATCLHWGVLRPGSGRAYVDPLSLVGRGPVVLLPLG